MPTLAANGLSTTMPIDKLLMYGYGALIEMMAETQSSLENCLKRNEITWFNAEKIELLARQFPCSKLLRSKLIGLLSNYDSNFAVAAARLLAKHFAGDAHTWSEIVAVIKAPSQFQIEYADGLLGFLAIGWRDAQAQSDIAQMLQKDSESWGMVDTLLMAVVRGDGNLAEHAAKQILAEPFEAWYLPTNTHALQAWVEELQPNDVLQKWVDSNDGSLAMTAISLFGSDSLKHWREPALREKFNQEFNASKGLIDGLDGVSRRTHSWCIRVLPTISPIFDS